MIVLFDWEIGSIFKVVENVKKNRLKDVSDTMFSI